MKIYVLIILLNINFAETIDRPEDPSPPSGPRGKRDEGFFRLEQQTELIKLYPNPAHDYITLEYQTGDSYSQMWFVIQNIAGKTLIQQSLEPGDNSIMINLSDLSANIYNLTLYGDGNLIEVKKITVIK